MTTSISDTQHYTHCRYAGFFNLIMVNVIMLIVVMLNAVVLNVAMLSVVMLSVVMLSVIWPRHLLACHTMAYFTATKRFIKRVLKYLILTEPNLKMSLKL